jgi:hypothetical protein
MGLRQEYLERLGADARIAGKGILHLIDQQERNRDQDRERCHHPDVCGLALEPEEQKETSVISVALTDLHDYPVGIDQPHGAPSRGEILEAQRPQRDRDRIADSREKRVQIVGLKSNMPDSSCILRPVSRGLLDRASGGMEELKIDISLAKKDDLFLAERNYSRTLEAKPFSVEVLRRLLIPAVERDV